MEVTTSQPEHTRPVVTRIGAKCACACGRGCVPVPQHACLGGRCLNAAGRPASFRLRIKHHSCERPAKSKGQRCSPHRKKSVALCIDKKAFPSKLRQTEHGTKNLYSVDGSCCSLGLRCIQENPFHNPSWLMAEASAPWSSSADPASLWLLLAQFNWPFGSAVRNSGKTAFVEFCCG